MQSVFSAPSRPLLPELSVEIVRRGAALKTLCILENSGRVTVAVEVGEIPPMHQSAYRTHSQRGAVLLVLPCLSTASRPQRGRCGAPPLLAPKYETYRSGYRGHEVAVY